MGADDLCNAKSINTEGTMQGIWNRTKSEKNSQLVFESETDPKYTISFEKVWSLAVKIGGEEGDKSWQYFWDPATKYLSQKPPAKDGDALSVEILSKDPGENKDAKINDLTNELELKNKEIRDLKNQLENYDYICRNQEKNLRDMAEGKRVDMKANKDKVKKQSASNVDPDDKPPFPFLKIPAAEDPKAQRRYPYPPHVRSSLHPENPAYYPPRSGVPPPDVYGPLPQGPPPYGYHRGYEAYAHEHHHPPFQPPYEPIPYSQPHYSYGDHLRHGEYYPGYSGGVQYAQGPPNPGQRPPSHEPPLHPRPSHYDQYQEQSRSNRRRPEREYAAGEPASQQQRRGEPVHMDSNHYGSSGLRQPKVPSAQSSNAANMGVGKSSVDQMYRRDHPPKSSVPSGNPYANVKLPIGNIGPRNGGNRVRESEKWAAEKVRDDHSRNPYESVSQNPYKDVVAPSAEVVEGSVIR